MVEARRPKKPQKTAAKDHALSPVHDMIGRKLREFYDDVTQQPVPDRFLGLLDELEAASRKKRT